MYIFIGRDPTKNGKIKIRHHPRCFWKPTLLSEIVIHIEGDKVTVIKNRYGDNESKSLEMCKIESGDFFIMDYLLK